jgi:hypothetical protein
MSIWSRLSTMVRSNLNDLIARAENPEKMLNQIIDDMRSQLAQAKQEVAVAIADERKLRQGRPGAAGPATQQGARRARRHAGGAVAWPRFRDGEAEGHAASAEQQDRGGETQA